MLALALFGGKSRRVETRWRIGLPGQVAETGPSPRDACGSAYDIIRQRMVIFGGEILLNGMVVNVGETAGIWTERAIAGPGAVVGPLMAYAGAYTLLFNPEDGTTWTWDGAHWTQRQKFGPGVRPAASLAFDDNRKRAVLGAIRQDIAIQETWELAEVI